jgi:hypothetical protein
MNQQHHQQHNKTTWKSNANEQFEREMQKKTQMNNTRKTQSINMKKYS